MRLEVEGALGSIVDEASKRTSDEVRCLGSTLKFDFSCLDNFSLQII